MKRLVGLLAVFLIIGARPAHALDPASADALDQTLRLLRDESSKAGTTPGVSPGSQLDRAMQGSPELRQELYDVAGEVFRQMVEDADGDVDAVSRAVERGQSDPEAFEASLNGATRERVRALAGKVQAAGH